MRFIIIGCGESECVGHGSYDICGEKSYNTIHFCNKCKIKIMSIVGIIVGIIIGNVFR